ncbi:MAG: aminopeptidase P family protein, partial [Oscillospiraceae bacterium]|nr:aminopeptidase P family protein [Oscillospiraceae bacterium]
MNRPQIKAETYLQRVKKMQELARANDYDVIIIAADEAEPANVRYFTGYVPVFETTAIMIPAEGEATLLIGPESEALTKKTSRIANYEKLLEFRETSDPEYPDLKYSTFAELIAAFKNIKRIGIIGANVMTVQVYLGILEGANGAEICRCDNLLRSMRMIKTPEEIEIMRYTAQIAQRGFESAIGNIAPGMTEHQVIAEFVHAIMKEGAECTGFP